MRRRVRGLSNHTIRIPYEHDMAETSLVSPCDAETHTFWESRRQTRCEFQGTCCHCQGCLGPQDAPFSIPHCIARRTTRANESPRRNVQDQMLNSQLTTAQQPEFHYNHNWWKNAISFEDIDTKYSIRLWFYKIYR